MRAQLYSFLKTGVLVQHDEFAACCSAYFGDITFQEAYERIGRVANINISVRAHSGAGARGALLLNHITSPHVLIRTAVHASCCLPTVMHPTTLLAKNSNGAIVPFGKDEAEFIDGSFTADIPRQRLSELFHVTQNIVSQVRAVRESCASCSPLTPSAPQPLSFAPSLASRSLPLLAPSLPFLPSRPLSPLPVNPQPTPAPRFPALPLFLSPLRSTRTSLHCSTRTRERPTRSSVPSPPPCPPICSTGCAPSVSCASSRPCTAPI